MSNATLNVIILVVVIFALGVSAVVFTFIKRSQYMREVQGKIKCIFLPESGSPYNNIVDVKLLGHEIAAPKDHHLPRYFFDKKNTWNTRYPDVPFLGLSFIQVQIATVWYYPDNPEPITSQAVVSPQIATASMIFASIDSAFALVVHELDAELQKTKAQLLAALSSKLSKFVVYGALGLIVIFSLVGMIIGITGNSYAHQIGQLIGVK
jgi:hypothetical protein